MISVFIAKELLSVGEKKGNLNGVNISKSLEGLPIVGFRYAVDVLLTATLKSNNFTVVIFDDVNEAKPTYISSIQKLFPFEDEYNYYIQLEMLKDFCKVSGISMLTSKGLDAMDIIYSYAVAAKGAHREMTVYTDLPAAPLFVISPSIYLQPLSDDKPWVSHENFSLTAFSVPLSYNTSALYLTVKNGCGMYGLSAPALEDFNTCINAVYKYINENASDFSEASSYNFMLGAFSSLMNKGEISKSDAIALVRRLNVLIPTARDYDLLQFSTNSNVIADQKMLAHMLVKLNLERYFNKLGLSVGIPSMESKWYPFTKWVEAFKQGTRLVDEGLTTDTSFFLSSDSSAVENVGGF